MATSEIKRWECPECGKVIESIYAVQFEHNVSLHKEKHKK
jgi:hypothetical protein